MTANYGRRSEDMPTELTPEIISNLTDSQKINLKIIQNLTSINTALNDLQHDVLIHDKLLVTGNGEPSLQERLRVIESYIDGTKYWSRFLFGAVVLQTLAFGGAVLLAVIRFLPVLEKLANQP
jgi:hypothetical protein